MRNAIVTMLAVWLLFPSVQVEASFDDDRQCPGKAAPRPDIITCLSNDERPELCVTGTEASCRTANGYRAEMLSSLRIVQGGAAVGGGYLEEKTRWGGNGTFETQLLEPGQREFSLRYYYRFGAGYQDYSASTPHSMQINVAGGAGGCSDSVQIDGGQSGFQIVRGSCPDGRVNLWNDDMHNGRWYLIEMYGRMETSCSDATRASGGCDGYFVAYLDGVKKFESTRYNWGGGRSGAAFSGLVIPRDYYHVGYPKWAPSIAWDNIVIGRSASLAIGASPDENPRGDALPRRYYSSSGANPMVHLLSDPQRSLRPTGDCSTFSSIAQGWDAARSNRLFRLDATMNAGTVDWLGTGGCRYSGVAADGALKLQVTSGSARSGFLLAPSDALGPGALAATGYDLFVGGHIFVPEGTSFEGQPIVTGLASTGSPACPGQYCQWIGLTISDGRWALAELYTIATRTSNVLARGTPAIRGVWHSYEVGVFRNGRADLWIDGAKVIDGASLPHEPGGQITAGFVGVSHLGATPADFSLFFDDIYWSTVSREECYGDWGSDCPQAYLGSEQPKMPPAVRPQPPTLIQ